VNDPLTQPQDLAARLALAWRQGARPDVADFLAGVPDIGPVDLVALLRVDQRERWRAGQRVWAEEYVRCHPLLEQHEEHLLDLVYGEFLLREELGEAPQAAPYLQRFPHLSTALRLQFGLHRALAGSRAGPDPEQARKTSPASPPGAPRWPDLPGYEILEELGRGGMGVVYKARQLGLDRLVALKMIRGNDPWGEHLARFGAEYRALARLRHPNIVPVYDVGEHEGRPYFAMELLDGGLDKLLARSPQPTRPSTELLAVLARAIHTAHEQGIVHRDLKPANILLSFSGGSQNCAELPPGRFCEPPLNEGVPKITDFGLAKQLTAEVEAAGAGFTFSGAILGSPCYLAPEQAAGGARAVTPAADIYALGAILYELLTGRPPFQGATVLETLDQVRSQEPASPAQLRPGCPRDLETICLKCLQKDPARRYASAADLAADLDRFLQGQPIQARPTPAWERGVKWARRRPAVAALAGALACAVLALAGVVGWSYLSIRAANADLTGKNQELRQARDSEAKEKNKAERRRKHAERKTREAGRNLAVARFVIDNLWTTVSQNHLLNQPGAAGLRTHLLKQAAQFYDRFVDEGSDDPQTQVQRGLAYMRYAQLTGKIASLPLALERYRKGLAIFEALVKQDPQRPEYRRYLAGAYNEMASLLERLNRLEDAQAAFGQAIAIQKRLPRTGPQGAEHRHALMGSWHNLGVCLGHRGRVRQAEDALGEALTLGRALVRAHPSESAYQRSLALVQTERGILFMRQGRLEDAGGACRDALACNRQIEQADPRGVAARLGRGRAEVCLANWCALNERWAEAEEGFQRARALFEQLVREQPEMRQLRHGLALAWVNLGRVYLATRRPDRARDAFRQSAALCRRLLKDHPGESDFRIALAGTEANLGQLFRTKGAGREALAAFSRAITALEGMRGGPARHAPAAWMLANLHAERAAVLLGLKGTADSLSDWKRAVELAGERARSDWRAYHGCALAQAGRHEEAAAVARDLLARKGASANALYCTACAYALCSLAVHKDRALPLPLREKRQEQYAVTAVKILARAQAAGFFRIQANRAHLDRDPDLGPLRKRPDYRKWRTALLAREEAARAGP
jgi:serine/threonine protein kinase